MKPDEERVLDFVTAYEAEQGHPPSVRRVADGVGFGLSKTHYLLRRLAVGGHLQQRQVTSGIASYGTPTQVNVDG